VNLALSLREEVRLCSKISNGCKTPWCLQSSSQEWNSIPKSNHCNSTP